MKVYMELPENCFECPFMTDNQEGYDGCFCKILDERAETKNRLKDCQLIDIKTHDREKDKRIKELEQDLEFTTKTANELIEIKHKLEQELAELKEKAIVPRFRIGQEVYVIYNGQINIGRIYEIQTNSVLHDKEILIIYLVDFYSKYEDDEQDNDCFEEKDIFITEQEALEKLKEIQGNE